MSGEPHGKRCTCSLCTYRCGYVRADGRSMYVMQKRGDGGKDWGYTTNGGEALRLTERMARIYLNEVPGRFCTPGLPT